MRGNRSRGHRGAANDRNRPTGWHGRRPKQKTPSLGKKSPSQKGENGVPAIFSEVNILESTLPILIHFDPLEAVG